MARVTMHRRMQIKQWKGFDLSQSSAPSSDVHFSLELIGKGTEVRQIAKLLHLSPKTVETHRSHIKEKLQLKNAREVARFALQWLSARS